MDPQPFVKWAGGKRHLAARVRELVGPSVRRLHEPFLGGGAVSWTCIPEQLPMWEGCPESFGSDVLGVLINAYHWIKVDVEGLILRLAAIQARVDRTPFDIKNGDTPRCRLYGELRNDLNNSILSGAVGTIDQAALFVALNVLGFNGLFRVNAAGLFNVPVGLYKKPDVVKRDVLRACSKALRYATIRCLDFEEACADARRGDAVYLDPPFVSEPGKRSFTGYTSSWGSAEDERVARVFRELAGRGVRVIASNSATKRAIDLYEGFPWFEVTRQGTVSAGKDRRKVGEILVWSGKVEEAERWRREEEERREKICKAEERAASRKKEREALRSRTARPM